MFIMFAYNWNKLLKIILVCCGSLFSYCLLAQIEPEAHFVQELIDRLENDPDYDWDINNYWWGEEGLGFDGGYLFRFKYDVTGDGKAETFVSSSINATWREGALWSIYQPVGNQYRKIATDIMFQIDGIAINSLPDGTTLLRKFSENGSNNPKDFTLVSYYISADGALRKEIKALTNRDLRKLATEKGEKKLMTYLGDVSFDTEKILMTDYCREKNPKWEKYNHNFSADQQYLDPEEQKKIKLLQEEGFSPEEALLAIIPRLDPKMVAEARERVNGKLERGEELTLFEKMLAGPDPRNAESPKPSLSKTNDSSMPSVSTQTSHSTAPQKKNLILILTLAVGAVFAIFYWVKRKS